MYLLDTDVLSNLLKRAPSIALIAKLAAVPAEWQFTSSNHAGRVALWSAATGSAGGRPAGSDRNAATAGAAGASLRCLRRPPLRGSANRAGAARDTAGRRRSAHRRHRAGAGADGGHGKTCGTSSGFRGCPSRIGSRGRSRAQNRPEYYWDAVPDSNGGVAIHGQTHARTTGIPGHQPCRRRFGARLRRHRRTTTRREDRHRHGGSREDRGSSGRGRKGRGGRADRSGDPNSGGGSR